MSSNSFGKFFKITSFGESHGSAMGVVIDGCPAGLIFCEKTLNDFLARRKPGSSESVSGRQESDRPEVLSGIFEGRTLGTPISILIKNKDARSSDYDEIRDNPRPGHADDVWKEKFGVADHRGGGRSSGRETIARVIGGAFAKMFLAKAHPELKVLTFPRQIGPIVIPDKSISETTTWGISSEQKSEIDEFLVQAKTEGQSYGGIGEVWAWGVPKGLGEPVFHKLKADLASAMMSIGATVGFELGDGFSAVHEKGTHFHTKEKESPLPLTGTPRWDPYGGIRGGISTGEMISFRVAFKPTSSVMDIAKKGRHDPCIVLRALPVMEAMTYLVLADHALWSKTRA